MGRKSKRDRRKDAYYDDFGGSNENSQVHEEPQEASTVNAAKLKQVKSRSKAAFTRARHGLLQLIDEQDLPSRSQVREARDKLSSQFDKVIEDLDSLCTLYEERQDAVNLEKITQEMEKIENEFSAAQNKTQEYLTARQDELSSIAPNGEREAGETHVNVSREWGENVGADNQREERLSQRETRREYEEYTRPKMEESDTGGLKVKTENLLFKESYPGTAIPKDVNQSTSPAFEIGQDLWKQLKRVSIPVFNGDKSTYENWKAAFLACIDKAPATPEYKLLQLRQYLSGEALKTVETLGHSGAAYEAAKSRLERKYGGRRRQIALHLEELENFKPIRPGYPKDIERFADILDIAVINLKEAGRGEELGNGSLYAKLQKKMTEQMLAQYHRWVYENYKTECVETLREWVIQEAEFQTIAAETLRGVSRSSSGYGTHRKDQTYFSQPKQPKGTQGYSKNKERLCKICEDEHPIWVCGKFKSMNVPKRWEVAKQHGLCYRCLRANHLGQSCTWSRTCGLNGCRDTHNRLLHEDKQKKASDATGSSSVQTNSTKIQDLKPANTEGEQPKPAERSHTTTVHANEKDTGECIGLRTVPVVLKNGNRKIVVNALLDDASTKTYVNSDVAAELGLQGENRKVTVNVLNGQEDSFETMPVECELESLDSNVKLKISAFTADRVTGNMKAVNWVNAGKNWNHLKGINFPYLGPRPIVDILIGIDYADLHYSIRDVRGGPGEPVARLTPLGWTCIGHPDLRHQKAYQTNFTHTYFVREGPNAELNKTVQRFWEVEEYGLHQEVKPLKPEDQTALQRLRNTMQFKDGRYEIGIPWKDGKPHMPDNYESALKRLQSTEKRLIKDPVVGKSYSDVLRQYEEKGYITKVAVTEDKSGESWYLPHFAVVRPDKATTKTRVVFDASAKCEGTSLNDTIHQGPKLQRELFSVLLRFRKNPVALVCDIAEMYLRIGLAPEDRSYHRFLWRSLDASKAPDVYEFNRVVFGVNSSPFQAQFVTQEHALRHKDQCPMAVETVLKSTYMDDSMDSTTDEGKGIELYKQLSELWGLAGMHARKWLSNSQRVLQQIPVEDRASEVDLDNGHLPSIKTLGVLWVADEDIFTFKSHTPGEGFAFTKRNFLKKIATLFDPLGFLAPYTVRAKIILQEMWTTGTEWDELMEEEQAKKAKQWFKELNDIHSIRIPRCLQPDYGELTSVSLHTFSDASTEAYGAVAYVRCQYLSGIVTVRMVASKSKVAPLRAMSVGRLELMGAVMGLRLGRSIATTLDMHPDAVIYWSDSMNVLWWIHRPSRVFKSFVANRIGEIQSASSPNQWRYVPTNENPADYVSRGLTVQELSKTNCWWEGPEFLKQAQSQWPASKIPDVSEGKTEVRNKSKNQLVNDRQDRTMVVLEGDSQSKLHPERFSSWLRLTRTYAWVYRFLNNCILPRDRRTVGELSAEEILDAEIRIIKTTQRRSFEDEYLALSKGKPLPKCSKLLALKPRLDEDGLIRSDGRLENAEYLPYDARFPVILPRRDWVTKLIVRWYHQQGNHTAGTNHTLAMLTSRFWILQGREAIRDCEGECYECRRRKAKAAQQVMAPLPKIRLKLPLRAFARTAVDFGGPFITVQGRGKRRAKRYLCLFTCLTSRAVHLEMAYSLDTDSFLNAFYRMASRRGLPEEMISDNGTNFVAADRELRELVENLDKDKIKASTANKGVKWHFNPPLAPHFGGVHETMIKAAKRAIKGTLGNADVTDEELMTAFIGAEGLLNSRPLTYQSANPADDVPLTPNHFLHGRVGGQFAPDSVDETKFNLRKRWRRIQELVRHFWNRWMREWLPQLNARRKWFKQGKDIKVGDVVLVMSPDTPRGQWPLGRITETIPGRDGHVRVVKVRIGQKIYERPISRLCPLECEVDD